MKKYIIAGMVLAGLIATYGALSSAAAIVTKVSGLLERVL